MEEKERQLISKANELYKKFGIKSVSMDDISTQMAISKKTLYKFVKDKNELVYKVVNYEMKRRETIFKEIFSKSLNAILELKEVNNAINELLLDYNYSMEYDLQKYYPEIFTKVKEKKRQKMFDSIVKNLKKGKEEGFYRKDLNEKTLAKLHVFRIENITETDQFSLEEINSPEFINEVFTYHLRGIVNKKGLDFLETL